VAIAVYRLVVVGGHPWLHRWGIAVGTLGPPHPLPVLLVMSPSILYLRGYRGR